MSNSTQKLDPKESGTPVYPEHDRELIFWRRIGRAHNVDGQLRVECEHRPSISGEGNASVHNPRLEGCLLHQKHR